jgi:bromodomain adjacent to zinc finger domain protein 1A
MNGLMETATKDNTPAQEGDNDSVTQEASDISDAPASDGNTSESISGKKSTRQKELRQKIQTKVFSKQREAARAQQAAAKQALADHRRLDEEVAKLDRRLEGIEREFRKLLGSIRVRCIGKDRFHNRIWWFDGLGSASLIGSGNVSLYGAGRLFIQGPSEVDQDLLDQRKEDDIAGRRLEEEGEEGILGSTEWAVYSDLEEVRSFVMTMAAIWGIESRFYSWKSMSHG